MSTSALIMMLSTQIIIIGVTGFFFWKVLTMPAKPEEDSYSDNDQAESEE
jgi:hypothetical protein